jgi:hypothetical protein
VNIAINDRSAHNGSLAKRDNGKKRKPKTVCNARILFEKLNKLQYRDKKEIMGEVKLTKFVRCAG